jgi:hypothetical protein
MIDIADIERNLDVHVLGVHPRPLQALRFQMGLSSEQIEDLINFLQTL